MKCTLVKSLRDLSAQVEQTHWLCKCERVGTFWCDWSIACLASAGAAWRDKQHKGANRLAFSLRNDASICLNKAQKAHKLEKNKN